MKVTRKTRLHTRAQNIVFVVLLLVVVVLIGWLSTLYEVRADWTAGHRNTLASESRDVVQTLHAPVTITAYASQNEALRSAIRELVGKYQRVDDQIHLKFVDPNVEPQEVRKLNISVDGELVVHYQGRTEKVRQHDESALTNALARISRAAGRSVVFITGHGELNPQGQGQVALSDFVGTLKDQGFRIDTLNLTETPSIPDDTAVLVIAGPRSDYLPGEVKIIDDYVKRGGNLLWLTQPGPRHGLKALADVLGVHPLDGTIVDATAPLFGVQDARWIVLNQYEPSPVTHNFDFNTLWPQTTALSVDDKSGWQVTPFLKSRALPRSWLEAGKMDGGGQVSFDTGAGDKPGPLDVGVVLTRPLPGPATADAGKGKDKTAAKDAADAPKAASDSAAQGGQQRVVVTGNATFLANAYVGYGGNLNMGLNLVNWLSHNDRFIDIAPARAPDRTLVLPAAYQQIIAWGFLVGLPLTLLIAGGWIWLRRRRY